uniref:guanine nucleotide exchange protein SMCR8-like n=1 Tax=Myxine glutinosa TaxID=7769 RepID=UPI00358EFC7F
MLGALEAISQVYEAYEDLDLRDTERLPLPVELGIPPWPWGDTPNPWSSEATFEEDFILLMEFCELVGPRPVLTIPEGAGGRFDKNFFALRVMSVDYQQSRAWETPVGHRGPWLHVARDSRQLLRHHGEGASAYVHHFTLHDMEARGFVRPFCMAFVSSDSAKLLPLYEDLVTDFGAVSECLKGGNRATFRRSLKELLGDLEHTKAEAMEREERWEQELSKMCDEDQCQHGDAQLPRRRRMSGERAAFTAESVERSNELGNLERLIFDTKQLLTQVAVACKQTTGQNEVDGGLKSGRGVGKGSDDSGCSSEEFGRSGAAKYIPKLYQPRKTRCSERFMKELQVLCGPWHYARAVEMLVVLQHKFKQDTHVLSFQLSPLWSEAFPAGDSSSCLFEEIRSPVDGVECVVPHLLASCPSRSSNTSSSSPEAFHSLESYASCVEDVPIKMMQQVSTQPGVAVGSYVATISLDPEAGFRASDDLGPEFVDQAASAESGDSIEVLNTEHLSLEVQSWSPTSLTDSQEHSLWTSKTDVSNSDGPSESHQPPHDDDGEKVPSSLRQPDVVITRTELLDAGNELLLREEQSETIADGMEEAVECTEDGKGFQDIPPPPALLTERSMVCQPAIDFPLSSTVSMDVAFSTGDGSSARAGIEAVGDIKHGYGLHKLAQAWPFLHHAAFAVLSGRTLVVSGDTETEVAEVVGALAVFVPRVPGMGGRLAVVKPWHCGPLRISELAKLRLVGVSRATCPPAWLQRYSRYVAYLNITTATLHAPPYHGAYLRKITDSSNWICHHNLLYLPQVLSALARLNEAALALSRHRYQSSFFGTYSRRAFIKLCQERLSLSADDTLIVCRLSDELMGTLWDSSGLQTYRLSNAPSPLHVSYISSSLFKA